MKKLLFLALLFCIYGTSTGQSLLSSPAFYVPADSIMMLNKDNSNWRIEALRIYPRVLPQSLNTTSRSDAEKSLKFLTRQKGQLLNRSTRESLPPLYAAIRKMQHAATLLRWTATQRFADSLQNIVYNDLFPYFHTQGSDAYAAAQAVTNAAQTLIMQDGQHIYINGYINGWTHFPWKDHSVSIDCITEMPFFPRVKLRVGMIATQTPLSIYIKIPFWQRSPLTIYVNGRNYDYTIQKGYAVIDRKWNSDDEIYFDLDFSCQIENGYIRRGPLLYRATSSPSLPIILSDSTNAYGHLRLQGKDFTAEPLMDLPPQP